LQEYDRAIVALEKAYRMNMMKVESAAILIPLCNAYKNIGDEANKDRIIARIQEILPEFDESIIDGKSSQNSYAEIYEKAKQYIADDQFEQAEELLNEANRAKEMAPTYKLLAMLYIKQKDYATAYDFCKKSYILDASDSENLINYINLSILKHDFKLASRLLDELKLLNVDENRQKQLHDIYNRKKLEYEQQNER
jgi:tetratricopeptide (TPR) repeat protein